MVLSYLLLAISITLMASIPYKVFSDWKKGRTNQNLLKIANDYKLATVNSDPPLDYPSLVGMINNVSISIEPTWTKDGGKFPVTHIKASISALPEEKRNSTIGSKESAPCEVNPCTERQYEVKILPNKTFMASPDEIYIKTQKNFIDNLYLIGIKRTRLAQELEKLTSEKLKPLTNEKLKPLTEDKELKQLTNDKENVKDKAGSEAINSPDEEIPEISGLTPCLIGFLEEGIQKDLHHGQLIVKRNSITYSATQHPFSKESLEQIQFLLLKLPELTKLSAKDLLFEK